MFNTISIPTVLIGYVALLFSLSVHEACHATAAYLLDDDTAARLGRMTLNPLAHMDPIGTFLFPLIGMTTGIPMIGWAKPVPVQPQHFTRKISMRTGLSIVSAAGPASNLVLSVLFLVVTTLSIRFSVEAPLERWRLFAAALHGPEALLRMGVEGPSLALLGLGGQLIIINIFLAIFNMIPAGPLDGAAVLQGFLPYRAAQTFERWKPYMYVGLLILVFTRLLWVIMSPIIAGVFIAIKFLALPLLGV